MIERRLAPVLRRRLREQAAVVLLGPRQVGKTTLARDVVDQLHPGAVYLDLERPADHRRLADADAFLRGERGRLVVLDEVHRVPELFPVLRGVIDDNRRAGFRVGQFLMLGSASLDLVNLSAESLAGRVAHLGLSGVNVDEAAKNGVGVLELWLRGGFPDSLLAADDAVSLRWRTDLIRSYLERDVPMFAPRLPARLIGRLWTMLAHHSGGLFNASALGAALGVSGPTVDRYVDLLADLGLVRRMPPWHVNTRKRMTKAPKVFVRDSGLIHALLELESISAVRGHPAAGSSFESFAIECLVTAAPTCTPHHYRTARGDEIDLLLVRGGMPSMAVEVKLSTAPTVGAGFRRGLADLGLDHGYVVHPGDAPAYSLGGGVTAIGLAELVDRLRADTDR